MTDSPGPGEPSSPSMELFFTHTAGIPETSHISVRIGKSSRQQASVAKLRSHPLKFPQLASSNGRESLRLRVLHARAEGQLVLHPLQERYSLKLRSHQGKGRSMSVSLCIRGHQLAATGRSRGREMDRSGTQDPYLSLHSMEQYMTSLLRAMAQ